MVKKKVNIEFYSFLILIFGSFVLKIGISQRLSIKGSVYTVFPAFDFNKAKDDLKYTLGLSCYI